MLRVKEIIRDGHEDLKPEVLLYMKSMADRHGFIVLDAGCQALGEPVRIEISYPWLRERVYTAILEDR